MSQRQINSMFMCLGSILLAQAWLLASVNKTVCYIVALLALFILFRTVIFGWED